MSDGMKIALAVGGLAAVSGIGYYLYSRSQSAATASAGGATTSPSYPTTLGPGGSSGALGPAAGTTSDGTVITGSVATGPEAANAPPVDQTIELG
jgi:hypothetical protein